MRRVLMNELMFEKIIKVENGKKNCSKIKGVDTRMKKVNR